MGRENGVGVWFILYAKDATSKKVVEQYVAGSISVDRDNIYYIERLSAAVFKTKVKNIKMGQVKILSELGMTTGSIIEPVF